MQRFLTSFALILALALSAEESMALGFGKLTAAPTLGQPLNFAIALRLDSGETLDSRCVKADVDLGDRSLPDSVVRTRVETLSGTGERRVRVTTTVPIDEPVVHVRVHAGCPPRLSRGYMVFADPPGRNLAGASDQPAEAGWIAQGESAMADVVAGVPPAPAASAAWPPGTTRRPMAPSRADRPERGSVAAAPGVPAESAAVPAQRPRNTSPRVQRPAAVQARGPVLRLDPIEMDALVMPTLRMATTLSGPVSPAASGTVPRALDPEQAERWRDQERLKGMESTLMKLRADSQASQRSLDEMRRQVSAAEATRYANPLVYALAGLCILLVLGLLILWWLRRRDRQQAAWYAPDSESAVSGPRSDPPLLPVESAVEAPPVPASSSTVVPVAVPTGGGARIPDQPLPPSFPPPIQPSPVVSSPAGATLPFGALDGDATVVIDQRRPMSAEELIDLEQQAEFFVVLGQDDAAIDLLMGHVRSTGGVSPLPYMKLLEIYRRRDEQESYDRIRERFNRRFNAYAPEWSVDPDQGLSLDGYPEVLTRLERAWDTPSSAMDLLDAALFRRDAGPTFDVPAYRELLFLYGIARDLAEHDVARDGVDVLLPLDADDTTAATSAKPGDAEPSASASFTLDLDVSTDQPPLKLVDRDFKNSKH